MNCGCAIYLRAFYLRTVAFPFDWLAGAPFKRRIELILDDFHGFLEKDNLQKIDTHCNHDIYKDKNTGFVFRHDFNEGSILDSAYPEVIRKYQRRIKRLYSAVKEAKNVLFVWWGIQGENVSDEDIIDAQKRISRKFNKNIYLLIIQNNNVDDKIKEICLGRYIINITAHISNGDVVIGDITIGNTIFSRIRTTRRRKVYGQCTKILIQMIGVLIPIKSLRHRVRNSLNQKMLGGY